MRHLALVALWAGVLQVFAPAASFEDAGKLFVVAGVLAPLTALLYRLAIAQVKALFDLALRRLEAIEHMLTDLVERMARLQRWQSRVDRRLDRLEARQHEAAEVVE